LKIAISGKGGVGKTTLSALLAHLYAREGKRVLAVDADPDANLASALGISEEEVQKIVPIAKMNELIYERTGAEPGRMGQWFTLNPKVDDIPDRFSVRKDGIRLLVMGGVETGGAGCACPENTLLKHLLRHLVVERGDTVIVDMEAGLEHLGRGTARAVDAFIVVVEPGRRSFQTAKAVVKLAADLGIKKVYAVANKVRPGEEEAIREGVEGLPLLGFMPYDPAAVSADLSGRAAYESSPALLAAATAIKEKLDELMGER